MPSAPPQPATADPPPVAHSRTANMEDDEKNMTCAQIPEKPEGDVVTGMRASAAVRPDVGNSAAPASDTGSTAESAASTASSSSSHQPPFHQGQGVDADLDQGTTKGCLISITSYSASMPASQIQMHAAASASVYGPICKVWGCAALSAVHQA